MLPLEISCAEVHRQLQDVQAPLLVDCREEEEQELVALDGALRLPMTEIQKRVDELAGREGSPVIVYCHVGVRSALVARWLRDQGFERAQSMAGGIDRWAQEIEPGMRRY